MSNRTYTTSDIKYTLMQAMSTGGYTFGDTPGRYIVSKAGGREFKVKGMDTQNVIRCIDVYIRSISHGSSDVAGIWIDQGVLYLDINTSTDSYDEAMALAVANKQLAIYDTLLDQELKTKAPEAA